MPELQDVFQQYGARYRQTHGHSIQKLRAMTAIEQRRTAKLGDIWMSVRIAATPTSSIIPAATATVLSASL